jgi:hypothetical protein
VVSDLFPLFAALDALVKILHALFDITAEHVFLFDLSLASLDDLVADACHEASHAVRVVVVVTELEDHTNTVEHLGKHLGDVSRLGRVNAPAWVLQDREELQTVVGCLEFVCDASSQLKELRVVRALSTLKDLDDLLEVLVL